MKHRSVIAFVIVAAALFAAPQLSHDLRALRGAVGARVQAGLMRALLSMPVSESAPDAVAAPRTPETLAASCTKEGAAAPSARQRKGGQPAQREEARAEAGAGEQLAMIEPPNVSGPPAAALPTAAAAATKELQRVRMGEVAMIIPPDSGIDPQTQARALKDIRQARARIEEVRMTYVASGPAGKGAVWEKREETLRGLEETLRGAFEFRVVGDVSKAKVLKVKRCAAPASCPPPAPARAPRAPRAAGQGDAGEPLPAAVGAVSAFVGE